MKRKIHPIVRLILGILALGLLTTAGLLAKQQYDQFILSRSVLPAGLQIAGLPVGGLTSDEAAQRLVQAYSVPVELHYAGSVIQVNPMLLGFEMDLTSMLTQAEAPRAAVPFWTAFWDFLMDHPAATQPPVQLAATVNEAAIRTYLTSQVAPRYDQPATQGLPVPASTNFIPGKPGSALTIDPAVPLIKAALFSLTNRTVDLTSSSIPALHTSFQNLGILLKQLIVVDGFNGVSEIYVQDLQTGEEIHFAVQQGKDLPLDIAFTAASTIKIPIMISTFRRSPEPLLQDVLTNLTQMIEISENDPADWLMKNVIGGNLGPLDVTQDIQKLGLKDTFLAGYFYPGAPLLQRIQTPANQRKDLFTDPDVYNQTTPAELGHLLADIYQCARDGSGPLVKTFSGEISQNECKQMVTLLIGNHLPQLITAGLPEGTQIAHKHGWITDRDGLLHTMGDAAIVYTPGGNFVFTEFMWDKTQLLFDPSNNLVATLARAIYNFYNQN